MPRFVIQQHTCSDQVHWDFMLEQPDNLATWQIATPPANWHQQTIQCQRIFDHRLKYLTYEGPLSQNRGSVKIVARGEYLLESADENLWQLQLVSDTIGGTIRLTKIDQEIWQLELRP
ncbi:MAG: hypothetical protein JW936_05480 [Sedimentisphaerales bacterium]|nr:hypothetical protein [Sedimentisphaerales bacterium]